MTQPSAPLDLDRYAPLYATYPTASHFRALAPETRARWLADLAPDQPLALDLHVPFCTRACQFCLRRTQATRHGEAVADYLGALEQEIRATAALVPEGCEVVRLRLGGGSPTVATPEQLLSLGRTLRQAFRLSWETAIVVETDPRTLDAARLDALARLGTTELRLGLPDVDPNVQRAIDRPQDVPETARVIEEAHRHGIDAVTLTMLYGLPLQNTDSVVATARTLTALAPSQIVLSGYAHLPRLVRRQRTISLASLPDQAARHAQRAAARSAIQAAGYRALGIDHFVRPGHPLATAAAEGRLHRGPQGYVADAPGRRAAVIGLGASALSSLPRGYALNPARTADWREVVANLVGKGASAGTGEGLRGHAFGLDDRLRGRAIERLLCEGRFDLAALKAEFGDVACLLAAPARRLMGSAPPGVLAGDATAFALAPEAMAYARLVAAAFDAYGPEQDPHRCLGV